MKIEECRERMIHSFERLDQAVRVVCAQSVEEVDLSVWHSEESCGTVCCAAGWCGQSEWFVERGFQLDTHHLDYPTLLLQPTYTIPNTTNKVWGSLAILKFFDLYEPNGTAVNWWELFGHRGSSTYDPILIDDCPTDMELFARRVELYKTDMQTLFEQEFGEPLFKSCP